MDQKITLSARQSQQLNLHLMQQMKLLQMNSMELEVYLKQAIEANPLLDLVPADKDPSFWQESDARQMSGGRYQSRDDDPLPDPVANARRQEETLQDHLMQQIAFLSLTPQENKIAAYIAGTLDSRGWWTEDPAACARAFGVPEKTVRRVLEKIQQLDPPGVGAVSLEDCLLIQLRKKTDDTALAQQIAEKYLELLGENRIAHLAKILGVTSKAVLAAKQQIVQLNPKPGASFAQEEPVNYMREDARVQDTGTGLKLTIYDSWGRKFTLNRDYLEWGRTLKNLQVKAYLKEQLEKARQLENLLQERQRTLLLVFQALVAHQEKFFRLGPGYKQALKLADLAEETGLAVSTVSRALQHKSIACRWGIFPAGSFLVGEIKQQHSTGGITDEKLEEAIRQVIDGEDKRNPLSDQGICDALAARGIQIARRTVNKYRTKMKIGGKSARKEWK